MMALQYARDAGRGTVRAILRRRFHTSDVWKLLARQRTDGSWHWPLLVDLRYTTGVPPTDDDLRQVLEVDARPSAERQPRGPLGILSHAPTLHEQALRYASLADGLRTVAVFDDGVESEAWLATQSRH